METKVNEERKPNAKRIREVIHAIELDPTTWDQYAWAGHNECGTTFCFAGYAVRLAGYVNEKGKPTDKGIEAIRALPEVYEGYVDGVAAEDEDYPFAEVAEGLLGLSAATALFSAQAARVEGNRVGRDDIELFKERITAETGVQFPDGVIEPASGGGLVLVCSLCGGISGNNDTELGHNILVHEWFAHDVREHDGPGAALSELRALLLPTHDR